MDGDFVGEEGENYLGYDASRNVSEAYKIESVIATGSYGRIYKASAKKKNNGKDNNEKDSNISSVVALKSYRRGESSPAEIGFLRVCSHRNVVRLIEVLHGGVREDRGEEEEEEEDRGKDSLDPHFVFEPETTSIALEHHPFDLKTALLLRESKGPVPLSVTKSFCLQLLCAVRHVHSRGIAHLDIKTSNILISHNGTLRLCDFGISRWERRRTPGWYSIVPPPPDPLGDRGSGPSPSLSTPSSSSSSSSSSEPERRQFFTTPYRPPELALEAAEFDGMEGDLWAVGCVLAELVLGRALFDARSNVTLIANMIRTLGEPYDSEWPDFDALTARESRGDRLWRTGRKITYESVSTPSWTPRFAFLRTSSASRAHYRQGDSLRRSVFRTALGEAVGREGADLILSLLRYDPSERLPAARAVLHEFFRVDPPPLPPGDPQLVQFVQDLKEQEREPSARPARSPGGIHT